jgi:hypothetical protein
MIILLFWSTQKKLINFYAITKKKKLHALGGGGGGSGWQLLARRNRYGFMASNANHKAENPLTALPWQRLGHKHKSDGHRSLY